MIQEKCPLPHNTFCLGGEGCPAVLQSRLPAFGGLQLQVKITGGMYYRGLNTCLHYFGVLHLTLVIATRRVNRSSVWGCALQPDVPTMFISTICSTILLCYTRLCSIMLYYIGFRASSFTTANTKSPINPIHPKAQNPQTRIPINSRNPRPLRPLRFGRGQARDHGSSQAPLQTLFGGLGLRGIVVIRVSLFRV